jgi:methanogenic corrinoid protein MtbC1
MSSALPLAQRRDLAARVRAERERVAEEVTREFLARHPDWLERLGDRARRHGLEDARFHCDFLAASIEAGSARAFGEYAVWTVGVLSSRGIAPSFVAESFEQIERALARTLAPAEAAVVADFVRAAVVACSGAPVRSPGVQEARSPLLQAILGGHRQAAANIALELLGAGHSVVDVHADLLQEALYEVGRLWERTEITVAQEHMATSTVQYVMARLYERIPRPAARRGRAIITGAQGELHQVGAMMVADALEADGWDVRFFGTNVPHAAVLAALADQETDLLGVSATTLLSLPSVVELFLAVRARFGPVQPRLVVGGAAVRAAIELCRELGAIAGPADLRQAVALLRPMAGRSG